jgi:plastocyanin
MHRKLLIAFIALLLVATGCSNRPKGAQKYAVDLDAKSTPREKFQFSAFFPGSFTASPGDSIKFRNRSTEAPHTVTFGVLADRSNQPPIITGTGENDVVLKPCASKKGPSDKLVKCPDDDPGPFDGQGYWNSGYLQPKPAPKSAGAKSVTVRLAKDITPGDYTFVCILHPLMNGKVTVIADENDRSTPADVRKEGREAAKDARAAAEKLEAPAVERDSDEVTVSAGYGDRVTSVNLYAPAKVEVDEGTTVNWEPRSPFEPHTVTFDSPFEVGDPKGFGAGGVASGSDYTGGFANSGIIGPKGSPFEGTFSLTFTKPGTYEYLCLLHPGQTGSVVVK